MFHHPSGMQTFHSKDEPFQGELNRRKIIRAPYYDQTTRWPNGCESVSTVMLLQYLGIPISVEEFMHRDLNYGPPMRYADTFEDSDQIGQVASGEEMLKKISTKDHCVLEAVDPSVAYIGDPWGDKGSWGCYAPVIMRALERVFRRHTAQIPRWDSCADVMTLTPCRCHPTDLTSVPMEQLCREYIDREMPVIFWATLDMKPHEEGPCWFIRRPDGTRAVFTWRSNEHCLLFVGYDDQYYYFNDPWHNHGCTGYERALVEQRHEEQYSMAVSVVPDIYEDDHEPGSC